MCSLCLAVQTSVHVSDFMGFNAETAFFLQILIGKLARVAL